MISFEINYGLLKGSQRITKEKVRRIFSRAGKTAGAPKKAFVSIAFVTKKEIAALNKRYRGKNGATDVLSFGADSCDGYLGEVVVCYQIAKSNSEKKHTSSAKEVEVLIAHGLLHLLGYDHRTKKEEKRMFEIQNSL
ncbi:MAG: rRNA maturation RNase YbeY [Patescibacteria group bacterium]